LAVSIRVAIAGGGIAGLSAAVALAAAGRTPVVYERSDDPAAGGGALLLWSNAIHALRELGLADRVLERATPVDVTEFRTFTGEPLWSLPLKALSIRAGAPTVLIHRSALIEVLLEAAGDVLRAGCACVGWRGDGPLVPLLADGREAAPADVLLGADGLNSRIRRELFGDEPVRRLGQVAWVATLDHPTVRLPEGTSVTWVGAGIRFWLSNLGDRLYWYTTAVDTEARPAPEAGDHEGLIRLHQDCVAPVPQLIAATPAEAIIRTVIRDRSPRRSWGRGRVSLVGDAAHPMTPDLGQGACQALEDAVVIGRTLGHIPDLEAALRCYEAERRGRTAMLTQLAWVAARRSMATSPVGVKIRDLVGREPLPWIAFPEIERVVSVRV
jgi:2-polyprenyl-6-methoxyphenol hydroxylase-like FAD-dependent oxidoreductase